MFSIFSDWGSLFDSQILTELLLSTNSDFINDDNNRINTDKNRKNPQRNPWVKLHEPKNVWKRSFVKLVHNPDHQ